MVLVSLHLGFAAAPGFAHNWVTRLQQGRCGALLVLLSPYLASKTAHRAAQGRVWVFSPKTNSPLPLKGEGRGVAFLWFVGVFTQRNPVLFRRKDGYFVSEGFSRQLPVATAGHNWLTRLQQGRSGALLVSLPYLASKTAHRATQGRVWFWLAGWRF